MMTYAALLCFIETEVRRAKEFPPAPWDRTTENAYDDLCREILTNIDREIRKHREAQMTAMGFRKTRTR